jgi:hypothetical protein
LVPPNPRERFGIRNFNAAARCGENQMLDVILIGLGVGFFALSVGYAYACERL